MPRVQADASDTITIAAGDTKPDSDFIVSVREEARVLASSFSADAQVPNHPLVTRTIAQLRKGKPSSINGLISVEGRDLIKVCVGRASFDRLELALNRIVAAAEGLGIDVATTEKAAAFAYQGELVGFSINEGIRREPHVLTPQELAEDELARKARKRRWSGSSDWDEGDFNLTFLRRPEWDYHPNGLMAFEFDQRYFWGSSPRRSFRDAKVQRLESMAIDIAVGVVIVAAAMRDDRLRREEEFRRKEEARRERERVQRDRHIEERRGAALDQLLEEVGSLDRLRRLVSALRAEQSGAEGRVGAFVVFAENRLAEREAALTAQALEQRLTDKHLFGEDDDFDFRPKLY
ncbi:hypothetical protein EWH10_06430 [Sphingobium fuliginis]|nr:hypothetical protein EWH10_06430 [Sphingobium fuliginis]